MKLPIAGDNEASKKMDGVWETDQVITRCIARVAALSVFGLIFRVTIPRILWDIPYVFQIALEFAGCISLKLASGT